MPEHSNVHCMTTYMAWADNVMLQNAEQLPVAELHAPKDTLFKTIAGTFDHTLVVGEMFQAHLENRNHPHQARHRAETLPFPEVARRLRAMNEYFVDLARRWTESELAETIDFEFVGGGKGAMTRQDILLHLVNHSTYHRGFVSALLFPYQIQFAPNDLTVFLRDVWSNMPGSLGQMPEE